MKGTQYLHLGPHDWTVYNDFYCSGEEGIVKLSITNCKDDQFTCNDGLCVDISDRFESFICSKFLYSRS